MLSSGEFVDVGEVFCVSDLAETLPSLSVSDSDKTSIVEVIVEFCSDTGELVDILVLLMCLMGQVRFLLIFVAAGAAVSYGRTTRRLIGVGSW